MLKQNWRLISRLERLGDGLIILASFIVAYYGRDSLIYWNDILGIKLRFEGAELAPIKDYFIVLLIGLFGYTFVLNILGAYSSMRLSSSLRLLWVTALASVMVFAFLAAVLFTLKLDLSRSFIGLFCILVFASLSLERALILSLLRYWRRRGRNFRNIIICGVGEQALKLVGEILARPELGLGVRAFADLREKIPSDDDSVHIFQRKLARFEQLKSRRILSGKIDLLRALREYAIDEVIFTDVVECMPQVEEMIQSCSEQGVRTTIAADLFSFGLIKSGVSYFGGMPLIHYQTPPGDRWELSVKRLIDIMAAFVLLIVLSPVLGLIALIIKLTSRSDTVLFRQKRVGLNGRLFTLYKFRSMRPGAEQELDTLRHLNEMNGPVFKMSTDPRVTSVGRFLRRHSLDELPQLWNVLRGDMSLVGPRPPMPGEVSLYERRDRRRLSMRPGLTCTWQVSGRNQIHDFENWVKLDLEYIDNWSLLRDFELIFKTIPVVFLGTGAR